MACEGGIPVAELYAGLDSVLVRLSGGNKRRLLQNSCDALLSQRHVAEATLRRLRQLNADIASMFELKSAAISGLTLRLFCSPMPSYEIASFLAVSYCWQDNKDGWSPVSSSRPKHWPISMSMAKELLELRESPREGIWIDNPCIDQRNESEKVLTIGSMDIIYRSARQLIIVIEDDLQVSEMEQAVALKCARFFQDCITHHFDRQNPNLIWSYIRENLRLSDFEHATIVRFLFKLISSRWYQRAWCCHEIKTRLPSQRPGPLFLLYGANYHILRLEHRFIHFFVSYLTYHDDRRLSALPTITGASAQRSVASNLTEWELIVRCFRATPRTMELASSVHNQLYNMLYCNCTVLTDMISIVLNLSWTNLYFTGKVQSTDECYWIITALALASGDMASLRFEGPKVRIGSQAGLTTSWVQSPRQEVNQLFGGDASAISVVTVDYIELDLFLFEDTPTTPSKVSLGRAKGILKGMFRKAPLESWAGVSKLRASALPKDRDRAKLLENSEERWSLIFLACTIDNGVDFVRSYVGILQEHIAGEQWTDGEVPAPNPRFEEEARELLSCFDMADDCSVTYKEEYLNPAIHFLTCMMDIRFGSYMLLSNPRSIRTGPSSYGLTEEAYGSLWLAIPVPVVGTAFFDYQVWLLEPYTLPSEPVGQDVQDVVEVEKRTPTADIEPAVSKYYDEAAGENPASVVLDGSLLRFWQGDRRAPRNHAGTWRLMKKVSLVGCRAVTDDGKFITRLKRQRVYG